MRKTLAALTLLLASTAHAVEPGASAPAFEAAPLAGGAPLSLASLSGKVVYLDFWASWCGPCRQSLPWMNDVRREFAARGFEVVAINVDETPADGRAFLKKLRLAYPVLGDAQGRIAALYDVMEMPSSYLIDRKGVVRLVHRGFNRADAGTLRDTIAQLVEEAP